MPSMTTDGIFVLPTPFACFFLFLFCNVFSAQFFIPASGQRSTSTYIIHMDKFNMPKAFTSHHSWYSSLLDSIHSAATTSSADVHQPLPDLIYTYDNVAHGFSASLSLQQLEALKKSQGFLSAYPDKNATLDTTHTTDFLKLNPVSGLWPASDFGKDVIVGVVDSGIWPESYSFKDHGISSKLPAKWKGICETGQEFNASMCNAKLIGVRYFNKGLIANTPGINITMNSARDTGGHGTHTASTVAGNYVQDASFLGYAKGTARGVAPRARLAVYKVLWEEGRYASDVLAAIDQAVADGVDVISISMGFGRYTPLYEDPIAIASYAAMEKGVFVSLSAGNRGSDSATIHNAMPWALTVAAGTIDRSFGGTLILGNGLTFSGYTLFPASVLLRTPLVYDKNISSCNSSMSFDGIIICDNAGDDYAGRVEDQINSVSSSNVRGAILISDDPELPQLNGMSFPGLVISPKDAKLVIEYATSDENPTVSMRFQHTSIGTKPAPAVAPYSSRGPARSCRFVSKPDLMAPGSLVLAAYNPHVTSSSARIGQSVYVTGDYVLLSGTSMACPHASGVAALLKSVHPEWSTSAMRSAMMTTSNPLDNSLKPIRDNSGGYSYLPASPTAMGAGQVDPNKALNPGLVYETSGKEYINLLCYMNFTREQILTITRANNYSCSSPSRDLNYPSFISLYATNFATYTQNFKRTLTNVEEGPATYKVEASVPENWQVTVSPNVLVFNKKHQRQSYRVFLKYKIGESYSTEFGSIAWIDETGKHRVRSPIVAVPSISLED